MRIIQITSFQKKINVTHCLLSRLTCQGGLSMELTDCFHWPVFPRVLMDIVYLLLGQGKRRRSEETGFPQATKVIRLKKSPPPIVFQSQLRTVPNIVIAHTFCASRDTRVSYG